MNLSEAKSGQIAIFREGTEGRIAAIREETGGLFFVRLVRGGTALFTLDGKFYGGSDNSGYDIVEVVNA